MKLHRELAEVFLKAGLEVYEVGGCVRDRLMGRDSDDVDLMVITTSLNQIKEVIQLPNVSCVEVGAAYGVLVFCRGDEKVDVALPRQESYGENRRDCVTEVVSDPVADLARRDFTFNAMAFDCRTHTVLDPFGGADAVKAKVVKAVGNPIERFQEDPLRVLRAFRFVARFGFELETNTHAACCNTEVIRQLQDNISGERKREELFKILQCDSAEVIRVFRIMEDTGVLAAVLPEISRMVGVKYLPEYHVADPFEHTLMALAAYEGNDVVTRLAILFHDTGKPWTVTKNGNTPGHSAVGKEIVEQAAERLHFTHELRDEVAFLVDTHMDRLEDGSLGRKLRRATKRTTVERAMEVRLADVRAMRKTENQQKEVVRLEALYRELVDLQNDKPPLTPKELAINGHDLMEIGVLPGPAMGRLLEKLVVAVLDGQVENEKATLLKRAAKEIAVTP